MIQEESIKIQSNFVLNHETGMDEQKALIKFLTGITRFFRNDISYADCQEVVQHGLIKLWDMSRKKQIKKCFRSAAWWVIRGVLKKKEFNTTASNRAQSFDRIKEVSIQSNIGETLTADQLAQKEKTLQLLMLAKNEVLRDEERDLIYRHVELKEEIKDIAASLGLLPNTLTKRYRRTLEKIDHFIEKHTED